MKLLDILKRDYSGKISVGINFSYGYVTILDRANGGSVFLQGDDAGKFIAEYETLYQKNLPVTLIPCHLAWPYLGND